MQITKGKNKSDDVMFPLALEKSNFISILFFKREGGELVLVVEKIIDGLKVADPLMNMNRQLNDMLQLTIFTGRLQVSLEEVDESKDSENCIG